MAEAGTGRRTQVIAHQGPDWAARALIDRNNRRLKLRQYRYDRIAPLWEFLLETARIHDLDRITVTARPADWQRFLSRGMVLEGVIDDFYKGEDPAYVMAYTTSSQRQASTDFEAKQELVEQVLRAPLAPRPDLPAGYRLQPATPALAPAMANLFDRVFETYPGPLADAGWLGETMQAGNTAFLVVLDGEAVASVAAADIDRENLNAEVTACATLPDYRGEGLMAVLVAALEEELAPQGSRCLFAEARARSHGMNLVLHRAGYRFRGRLVNSVHICGQFDDMNLWVKALS